MNKTLVCQQRTEPPSALLPHPTRRILPDINGIVEPRQKSMHPVEEIKRLIGEARQRADGGMMGMLGRSGGGEFNEDEYMDGVEADLSLDDELS